MFGVRYVRCSNWQVYTSMPLYQLCILEHSIPLQTFIALDTRYSVYCFRYSISQRNTLVDSTPWQEVPYILRRGEVCLTQIRRPTDLWITFWDNRRNLRKAWPPHRKSKLFCDFSLTGTHFLPLTSMVHTTSVLSTEIHQIMLLGNVCVTGIWHKLAYDIKNLKRELCFVPPIIKYMVTHEDVKQGVMQRRAIKSHTKLRLSSRTAV